MEPTDTIRVHKKDYLIEIPGVPLSTKVASGKQDNSILAAKISEASKLLSPGVRITRIFWLYGEKQLERMRTDGKQRGSLVIGVATEEMRRKAIRGGLVLDAQYYETRLFEKSFQKVRCFKCQQWGHTQAACVKQARCGSCAGKHDTRRCQERTTACANCGGRHKAWQVRDCTTYQHYHDDIQRRRVAGQTQTTRIREASDKQGSPEDTGDWTVVRKRQREASPIHSQRRVGRPTYIEQAGRDTNQARLTFEAAGSQAASSREDSEMDLTVTPNES